MTRRACASTRWRLQSTWTFTNVHRRWGSTVGSSRNNRMLYFPLDTVKGPGQLGGSGQVDCKSAHPATGRASHRRCRKWVGVSSQHKGRREYWSPSKELRRLAALVNPERPLMQTHGLLSGCQSADGRRDSLPPTGSVAPSAVASACPLPSRLAHGENARLHTHVLSSAVPVATPSPPT